MDYSGIIIQESLQDTSILSDVKILETKVEPVTVNHKTPWLQQWMLHTISFDESNADTFAKKLSVSLETEHTSWYADFKNDIYHFIVFPNKIFKVDLNNPVLYKDAKRYGISLGIPEHQVDFAPDDNVWKR